MQINRITSTTLSDLRVESARVLSDQPQYTNEEMDMADQKMVRIMCPNLTCRKVLSIPELARGKTVRCKSCGTNIRVPDAKPTEPATDTQA